MATVERSRQILSVNPNVRSHPRGLPLEKRLGKVLITGANGFLGSNITASLNSQGVEVFAAVRSDRRLPKEIVSQCGEVQYRSINFDSVEDLERTIEDVDTIVHSAGKVAACSYREFLETNRTATLRLFEAASRQAVPPRIILISSIAASGPRVGDQPRNAEETPEPISRYGRSKLAGERIARRYADRVPITILRPGMVFGPGDREFLRIIKVIARTHLNIVPGFHRPRFPFIAVQDLVECIVKAIDVGARLLPTEPSSQDRNRESEGVYFASDPQCCSFAQFGRWVSRGLGQRWDLILPIPLRTLRNAARFNTRFLCGPQKANSFSVDKIRDAAAKGWECDISKTMHELNWSPAALLEERVSETIKWYRHHNWI